ncbi:hypothethical protein (plasmid) [Ralstonia solanacearum CMR15]|nr:hypothethical protein [Ralstonia solanacearum CMR15]
MIFIQTDASHPNIFKLNTLLTGWQPTANEISDGINFEFDLIKAMKYISILSDYNLLLAPSFYLRKRLR